MSIASIEGFTGTFTGTREKFELYLGLIGYRKVFYTEGSMTRTVFVTKLNDHECLFLDIEEEVVSIYRIDDIEKAIELYTGTVEQFEELYKMTVNDDERETIPYALGFIKED
jgi:hypothetical protein